MSRIRWVGLVFSLLIVGVLGGLMAPPPSEAGTAPTITLQFDPDGTPVGQIYTLTLSRVTGALCPTGYTDCWQLPINGTYFTPNRTASGGAPSRAYTITHFDTTNTGQTARVLVVDNDTTGQDTITFTNTQIAPCAVSAGACVAPFPTTADVAPVDWGSNTINCGTCSTLSPWGEAHKLKIVITKTFEVGNTKTVGTAARYAFSLNISGQFAGGPKNYTGRTNGTASGNYINWDGVVQLGKTTETLVMLARPTPGGNGASLPSGATVCNVQNSRATDLGTGARDTRYCPLKRTFGYAATSPTGFSQSPTLRQGDGTVSQPYPTYFCDNSLTINSTFPNGGKSGETSLSTAKCTPRITITMIAGMNGPDAFQLSSSGDGTGGSCNLDNGQGGAGGSPDKDSGTAALPCNSNGTKNLFNKMSKYLDDQQDKDEAAVVATGAVYTPACEGDQCPCWDTVLCTGTIAIELNVNPASDGLGPFPFTGSGDGINFPVTLADLPVGTTDGFASKTFPNLYLGGGPWSFTADLVNWPTILGYTGVWKVDIIKCESELNDPLAIPPIIVSTWTVDTGDPKRTAKVTKLGRGDKVTCRYHGHKNNK